MKEIREWRRHAGMWLLLCCWRHAHDDCKYNFYLVLFLIGMTPIATNIWSDLVKQGDMAKMLWWPLIWTSILVETNHGCTTPGLFRMEKKSHKPWYTLLLTPSIPTCQRQFSLSMASIEVICMGNVPENVCWKIAATNGSLNISLTFKVKNHLYRRLF